METKERERIAMKVAWITIAVNMGLAVIKFTAGIVANSSAIIADAVNSTTDVCGTVIVMIGVKMSGKASDTDHQYGHERMECVAAILLSAILFFVGVGVGYSGVLKIAGADQGNLPVPGMLAFAAALFTLCVKELMFWYTRANARKINSIALMAAAWDHRADTLSSTGCIIAILGARMGYAVLDPIAAVIICLIIIRAAYKIFREAVGKMTDKACDEKSIGEIRSVILEFDEVLGIDLMKTRIFGNMIYVDIEIKADGNLTLKESHEIAEKIHEAIEERIKNVKHCMVHVNPAAGTD